MVGCGAARVFYASTPGYASQRKESFVRREAGIGVVAAGFPCANHAHTHAHAGHEGVIGPQRQGVFYAQGPVARGGRNYSCSLAHSRQRQGSLLRVGPNEEYASPGPSRQWKGPINAMKVLIPSSYVQAPMAFLRSLKGF